MNILVENENPMTMEVAKALEEQATYFPFARLCDIKVETFPKELGRIRLTIVCIAYPKYHMITDINIGLLRHPDTARSAMAKILQTIAAIDVRTGQQSDPLKIIHPMENGG